MDLSKIGEFGLISFIKEQFSSLNHPLIEGIGDDCAVINTHDEHNMVLTTDLLVEGKHFILDNISPYELGYKTLAVNLSDVASMGATPYASLLGVALGEGVSTEWAKEFIRGYHTLSEKYGVALIGGDTTAAASGASTLSVTALGRVNSSNIKRRSAAELGDLVVLNRPVGDSSLALRLMLEKKECPLSLRAAHNMPEPMIAEGVFLGSREEVGAMMDVSDGIASDLRHICKLSGCGAKIFVSDIPQSQVLKSKCEELAWPTMPFTLSGGEDYALLFTLKPEAYPSLARHYLKEVGGTLSVIGEIVEGEEIVFLDSANNQLDVQLGFRHF